MALGGHYRLFRPLNLEPLEALMKIVVEALLDAISAGGLELGGAPGLGVEPDMAALRAVCAQA